MELRDWCIVAGFVIQLGVFIFCLGRTYQKIDATQKLVVALKKWITEDHQTVVTMVATHNINHPETHVDLPSPQLNGNGWT